MALFNNGKIKGFTLIELIIVLVIVGVLATLAVVRYGVSREDVLDSEAKENLKLIQSAEKFYHIRFITSYYPSIGSTSITSDINNNLKLDLPDTTGNNWSYQVFSTGCAFATRSTGTVRYWHMAVTDTDPVAGSGCP